MSLGVSLVELPPEVLLHICSYMSGVDLGRLSMVCRHFHDLMEVDAIWQRLCREIGVAAIHYSKSFKEVYINLLHHSGCLLGLWKNVAHIYGGLVSVEFVEDHLAAYEYGSIGQELRNPLSRTLLFTIEMTPSAKNIAEALVCHQRGRHSPQSISLSQNKIELICQGGHIPPGTTEIEDVVDMDVLSMAEISYMHSLNRFEYQLFRDKLLIILQSPRLLLEPVIISTNERPSPWCPIAPGLFKGSYGGHGIEVIQLKYDLDANKAVGLKITGDPNIPATKVTIEADLSRPMVLTREQQSSLQLLQQIDLPDLLDVSEKEMCNQPFVVPSACYEREAAPPTCSARFHSRGQIANESYTDARFIPGHWIVFDEDTFGHLWMQIHSFSLFTRIKDDELRPLSS
ncbi:hypothetical protein CAPTEDRAFT_224504 [Capitella teleta]|uniref:F-box domain-containing protein n=1 Tax=Capitella teleta TaxID=283909 RepID=R7TZN3_CAPTE|nr:hypothetical protein CAPTEDRAFT_224504 [Capitella teleta]|eukprot:ELT96841.1 hypothetical protein CAPTEDRAFT_224504 [Capitella teleta]